MDNYSLSDIRAATDHDDGDFSGQGSWFWIVVLFLFMFGFGGTGFGGNGALTKADLCQDFNFNDLQNGVRGIQNGLCDGFYAQNTTMLQGFNSLGQQLSENRFAQQNCCCETNRNIDSVRAETTRTPARSPLRSTTKVSRLVLSLTAIRCRLFVTRLLRRIRNCRLLTSSYRSRLRTQL